MDIKTGVIGIGSMGRHHARIYNPDFEFSSYSESDEKLGFKLQINWGEVVSVTKKCYP